MELSAELTRFERTPRDDAPPKKAKMTEQEPTKDDFQELGAEIMNRSPESSTSDFESNRSFARRWVSHFELVPYVVAKVWGMLAIEAEEKDAGAKPVHLLWALLLLKTYNTETVLAGICEVHEDTFRKWAWLFIEKVSYLEHEVVCFYSVKLPFAAIS